MKKTALVLIFSLLCTAVFALPEDYRFRAMGNVQATGSANPASIYFHDRNDFFSAGYTLLDSYSPQDNVSFPFRPEGDAFISFTGRYLSFTGNLVSQCVALSREPGVEYYTGYRTLSADVVATAGLKDIVSAGIGLNAGLLRERENFAVSDKHRITDFFLNTVTGRYDRVEGSEFANVRVGVRLDYNSFTIGVMAPSVFVYEEGKSSFCWEGLSVGAAFNGNRYYGRARLNPLVISVAAEAGGLGTEKPVFSAGIELMLQIVTGRSVSLRGGFSDGSITAGIGARIADFELAVNAAIPLKEGERYKYSVSAAMHY